MSQLNPLLTEEESHPPSRPCSVDVWQHAAAISTLTQLQTSKSQSSTLPSLSTTLPPTTSGNMKQVFQLPSRDWHPVHVEAPYFYQSLDSFFDPLSFYEAMSYRRGAASSGTPLNPNRESRNLPYPTRRSSPRLFQHPLTRLPIQGLIPPAAPLTAPALNSDGRLASPSTAVGVLQFQQKIMAETLNEMRTVLHDLIQRVHVIEEKLGLSHQTATLTLNAETTSTNVTTATHSPPSVVPHNLSSASKDSESR